MRRIIELASNVRVERDSRLRGSGEVCGITTGRHIGRLLPSELVLLADPDSEIEFFRRFVDESLLEYEVEDRSRPVVFVRDSSTSMGGDRGEWAAAAGVAMLDATLRAGRRFVGIVFSTVVEEYVFPGADRVEFASIVLNGGTDFGVALSAALRHGGDIVFASDGEYHDVDAAERFRVERENANVKCHGVALQHDVDALMPWCDTVTSMKELSSETVKEAVCLGM